MTFRKDLATHADGTSLAILQSSWGLLILTLGAGVFSLLALTGQLSTGNAANLYAGGLRFFWIVQILAFCAGMGLFGVFGIREV
ncbi:hypothetical protein ACFVZC_17100 [Streptomyces marokkonensis]|uniref:Uncharacterized protein n=1 Tax=Streptomyces marokkonensis TaxID=324855 RepID=A0ABW6Q8H3_9ACTN